MRIAMINMWHKGSTGRIMLDIADQARKRGHEVWTFSPHVYQRNSIMETPCIDKHIYFGYRTENMMHYALDRLTGMHGCFSCFGMEQLLRKLDEIRPDIIHLHNLHNYTFCISKLFRYIKRKKIRVIWTLHDCWAMTGRCSHFMMEDCQKWKDGCGCCPQIHMYPKAYVDLTGLMWRLKKKWLTSVENMTIVTPSQWLAGVVKESYLQKYPVKVINNGIDLSVFKPTRGFLHENTVRENKKIVLGVAADWSSRKGLDVFIRLAERLPAEYQIVLVGTDEKINNQLPDNIMSIHRTRNQQELAEIYSFADVFVNPTREDTFPTVNIEALACGTPVLTFATGGSPEIIDATSGIRIPYNDVGAMERAIYHVCERKPFSQMDCLRRAKSFKKQDKFQEYVDLYEQTMM